MTAQKDAPYPPYGFDFVPISSTLPRHFAHPTGLYRAETLSRHGAIDVMGFGTMEIIGKYPAHWRASTCPTALMVGKMSRLISYPFQAHCRDISPTLPGYRATGLQTAAKPPGGRASGWSDSLGAFLHFW